MLTSTMTQKGQTTLPKQIRQKFHLDAGNKLIYEIRDDSFVVRPHPGVMASYGALKVEESSDASKKDINETIKQARTEWAENAGSDD